MKSHRGTLALKQRCPDGPAVYANFVYEIIGRSLINFTLFLPQLGPEDPKYATTKSESKVK